MNERKAKLNVGIFVTLALLLLLSMLFFFGLSEIFVNKAELYTTFSESVQGLNIGSDVKYRGVKIGSVTDIKVMVVHKKIRVDMSVDLKSFTGSTGKDDLKREKQFRKFISREIAQGLRCKLEFAGITGMKYVDLDYVTDKKDLKPLTKKTFDDDAAYIPSEPSSFNNMAVSLTEALEKLSKVRFEAIADEIEDVLRDLNTILSDPALKKTLQKTSEIASSLKTVSNTLNTVLSEERLVRMAQNLENNLSAIEGLVNKISTTTTEMKLPESTASFREAAESFNSIRGEFSNTLLKLNVMIETFQQLCETIQNNPGYLIGGESEKTE